MIADASKLGVATSIVVGPATIADTLVTDTSAARDEVAALRALGLEVIIVGADAVDPDGADRAAIAAHAGSPAGAAGAPGG